MDIAARGGARAPRHIVFFALCFSLTALLPGQVFAAGDQVRIVPDAIAARALEEAIRYAETTYAFGGETYTGVAYRWGGRMTVESFRDAVASGRVPGSEAGVDASALVVNAYRAADPALRFRTVQGGEERWVADATSRTLFEWNIVEVPYTSLRPGDLIFFQDGSGNVSGVAIFDRREGPNVYFVVASAASGRVIRTFLNVNNEYWRTRVKTAGRLLEMPHD